MTSQPYHIPALLQPSIDALNIKASGCYVDCTLGGAGHTTALLLQLQRRGGGTLLSFDRDIDAIERALANPELMPFLAEEGAARLQLVHGNFRYLTNFLDFYGHPKVDGILADLGVSFHHFDDPERGFSFRWDGPLDMRMNRLGGETAADLLARVSEDELTDILTLYGELRQGRRFARAILAAGHRSPLTTVEQLLSVVSPMVNPRQEKKELAQLFQALRIAVNDEIESLRELLTQSAQALNPGGRLAVITYHSLEDRLVKNFLKTGNLEGKPQKDFYGRVLSPFRLLTSKPLVPDEEEIERNPRSRSAKLRIAEFVGAES